MNASSVPIEIIIAPQKFRGSASFSRREKEGLAQTGDKVFSDIVIRPVHVKTPGVFLHQASQHHVAAFFGVGDKVREKTDREPTRFGVVVDDVHQREQLAGTLGVGRPQRKAHAGPVLVGGGRPQPEQAFMQGDEQRLRPVRVFGPGLLKVGILPRHLPSPLSIARADAQTRSRISTFSTWAAVGNISTGWAETARHAPSRAAKSLA